MGQMGGREERGTKEAIDDVVHGDHLSEVLEPEENPEDGEVGGVEEEPCHRPDHYGHGLRAHGLRV